MKRTIIFGDVHGCYDELQDLLKEVQATEDDQLISVGDLVCKGPHTRKVLDWAMAQKNLQYVLGNHEMHLLCFWKNVYKDRPMKDYQKEAFEQLGEETDKYLNFLETWPLFIDTQDYIVLHAGMRPKVPLEEQSWQDFVSLRTIEPNDEPWYKSYKGKKLIVHGHWAAQGLVVRDNVIGLDSGCVYGKKLSAVILPERKIVSVPAREQYAPII